MSVCINRSFWLGAAALAVSLLASCARDPEIAKREYLESGNRYAAEERYREAIIEYRNAVERDPRFAEARLRLAEAYVAVGDAGNAFREYVRAADLMPDDADVQLKAGAFLLMARQFEDAKSRAQNVLARAPRHVDAQILLGNAMAGLRDVDGAIAELEEAIQIDPRQSRTYTSLGVLHFMRGNRADAEAALTKALAIDPRSVTAHLALANFRWSTGRYAEVEHLLDRALEIEPANPLTNRMLAMFYMATNRAAEAEAPLKAVAKATSDPAPRLMLADYYVETRRVDAAIAVLDEVARDARAYAAARIRLASAEYARGRVADAHAVVDEVLKREPANAAALVVKGRFRLAEGQFDEAKQRAKAAITADPRSAAAHYLLGLVHSGTPELEEAIRSFNEVLRLNPRAADAQVQLARVHLELGNTGASVQFAQQALNNEPGHPIATLLMIRGLLARHDFKVAEAELKRMLARYPDAAPVHSQYGAFHLMTGNAAAARQAFERALDLDRSFIEPLAGLVMLDLAAKRPVDARRRLEGHLAEMPANPELLLLAARTYAAAGDHPATERSLRRLIEIDPANLQAYGMLGQLYLAEGRLDEAKHEFEELANRQPTSVTAPTMVALILEYQDQPAEAQRRYEQTLTIDPRAAVAANNLAWMYAERGGNLDVALQLARTAKQQLPHQPEVNDTLGWIYYKKDLVSLAIPALQESIAADAKNPLYHYHIGLAYQKLGERTRARQALEQALALAPEFDGAAAARQALDRLASS